MGRRGHARHGSLGQSFSVPTPPHPGWIVDELMEALRYDHTTTGPGPELELSEERKAP
jgi:hypothetical protein